MVGALRLCPPPICFSIALPIRPHIAISNISPSHHARCALTAQVSAAPSPWRASIAAARRSISARDEARADEALPQLEQQRSPDRRGCERRRYPHENVVERHVCRPFDESGDHGLDKIDPDFPVFVLCGWLFEIEHYLSREIAAFSAIKFAHFGHEIRKRIGPFQILANQDKRTEFMAHVSKLFENCSGVLLAAAIDKRRHTQQYKFPADPYSMSLLFCLERLYGYLHDAGVSGGSMTCVFEQRGEKEDNELSAHFTHICAGNNYWGKLPFNMVFASKLANMPGLQMADLAAYPIARHVMNAKAPNPAYDIVEKRFRRSPDGKILGWGLKVFP